MRLLADSLQIKTASLYNHIKSMDELITAVCEYGLQLQKEMEMDAVKEQHGEQAVRILADTYRLFAKEHRQLYWLIMNTAAKDHQVLDNAAILITDPLKKIFQDFHLQNKELVHYRRLFRAIVHGFISQEEEGFFSHYPTPVEESFYFSIQCFIDCLKQGEMRCLHNERKK